MVSRSLRGCAVATGEVVRMQPDRASAVIAAMIGNRNARATRTGAIPSSETAKVLHRLWLINGCLPAGVARPMCKGQCARALAHDAKRSGRADAGADWTRHAGAAKPAIAGRVLGQILLVIVFGEI